MSRKSMSRRTSLINSAPYTLRQHGRIWTIAEAPFQRFGHLPTALIAGSLIVLMDIEIIQATCCVKSYGPALTLWTDT